MRILKLLRTLLRRKIVVLLILSAVLILAGYKISRPVHYVFVNEHYTLPCNLPVLDPFDPSIQQFFWKPEPVQCPDFPSIVFVNEFNVLHLNESALTFYGLSKPSDLRHWCTVESIYRNEDDRQAEFNTAKTITLPASLDSDFTRVTCRAQKKVIFENVVASIQKRHTDDVIYKDESEDQLSVVLFGLDSVSRSASVRYLPKTLEVLRELGSYDFQGLMKIGDNTIPNIMGMLAGLKMFTNETYGFEESIMDHWPFIWKNYSAEHYVTMFGEDLPFLGMFNINSLKGFREKPTDHYLRPFWLALGKIEKLAYHMSNVFKFFEDKGLSLKTSPLCNQNTMNHNELINYIKRFMLHYRNKRKFALTFLTELSHTFINFLHHGDEDFKNLFLWMKHEGFLEKTVVVFFSDHGSRFEDIRNTFVGRMESRMPMLHILLPEHIKKKYPDVDLNMKKNTHRLITHYDIHQTLQDVLNKKYKNPTTQIRNGKTRAVSLFQEVSSSRSCEEAEIPADFCACYKSQPVNVTESAIKQIAEGIVNHINNNLLSAEPKCQRLRLNRILSAQQLSQGLKHAHTSHNGYSLYQLFRPEKSRESYSVIIETVPGLATFDASCELEPKGGISNVKNVDRTNTYGNQSACISNRLLKQYCYC